METYPLTFGIELTPSEGEPDTFTAAIRVGGGAVPFPGDTSAMVAVPGTHEGRDAALRAAAAHVAAKLV